MRGEEALQIVWVTGIPQTYDAYGQRGSTMDMEEVREGGREGRREGVPAGRRCPRSPRCARWRSYPPPGPHDGLEGKEEGNREGGREGRNKGGTLDQREREREGEEERKWSLADKEARRAHKHTP